MRWMAPEESFWKLLSSHRVHVLEVVVDIGTHRGRNIWYVGLICDKVLNIKMHLPWKQLDVICPHKTMFSMSCACKSLAWCNLTGSSPDYHIPTGDAILQVLYLHGKKSWSHYPHGGKSYVSMYLHLNKYWISTRIESSHGYWLQHGKKCWISCTHRGMSPIYHEATGKTSISMWYPQGTKSWICGKKFPPYHILIWKKS